MGLEDLIIPWATKWVYAGVGFIAGAAGMAWWLS
ncbi:hypothetical protein X766_15945 [Mesorhizobium sp. LSJC255A00]|nr:hypothetical protein X766_15945 [Mesorhizobium sp. LSJC255A00]